MHEPRSTRIMATERIKEVNIPKEIRNKPCAKNHFPYMIYKPRVLTIKEKEPITDIIPKQDIGQGS